MTAPTGAATLICASCQHGRSRHAAGNAFCTVDHCECEQYKLATNSGPTPAIASAPRPSAPASAGPPPQAPPSVQIRLLAQAEASPLAATRKLGEKVAGLIEQLREALRVEGQNIAAYAEIRRLEAELAIARAKLGNASTPTRKISRTPEPPSNCPHCPKVLRSAGGLSSHLRSAHSTNESA